MKSWLVSLAGAVLLLFADTALSAADADELGSERLTGLASANVGANLQALRDDFALVPSEAKRLAADVVVALNDGTAVRSVTFALILVVVGAGLEWLYWTFAAAPLRAVINRTATTPRHAVGLALRRLGYRLRRNAVHRIHSGGGADPPVASERRCIGDHDDSAGSRGPQHLDYR